MQAPAHSDELSPRSRMQRFFRATAVQVGRLGIWLSIIMLAALATTGVATALQAGRNETQAADLAVVLTPDPPQRQLILHTIDLYRRGHVSYILPVGAQANALRVALGEAGVSPDAILDGVIGVDLLPLVQVAGRDAQAGGASRVLLVSAPATQLVGLKMLRDQGLEAYGSPPSARSSDPLAYLNAALDYWRYALSIGMPDDVVYSR